MCGIAGWRLTEKAPDVFYLYLAAVMQERGEQAFGFYDGSQIVKGKYEIVKGLPVKTMATREGFLHTRYGTQGANTPENAHPYAIGNLVGAHNGTLSNHDAMNAKHKRNCAVDSMHIFEHIAANLPLTDLEGYGAIEFHQDGTWYVGACNGGSLEVARTSIGLVWASTQEAIKLATSNAGITLETFYEIEQGRLYRVETDSLYNTDRVFDLARPAVIKDWRAGKASNSAVPYTPSLVNNRLSSAYSADYGADSNADYNSDMAWDADAETEATIIEDLQTVLDDPSLMFGEHMEAQDAMDRAIEGVFSDAIKVLVDYFGDQYVDGDGMQKCEWCGETRECKESFECFLCVDCTKLCQ